MSGITQLSATRLNRSFLAGELSALEITEAHLQRIQAVEPKLRAYITVTAEQALERARKLDSRRKGGADPADLGPLAGVPVAIKDNMCTQGVETTCASRMLKGFVPPYDATAVARLQGAGAIILGKTNMDEFAMGSSCENSAVGCSHNPWDLTRVPGGSSGGSAVAVAAETCAISLGSDTGGSIRQPAAFCGVVGLKPTYGAVSRYGLIAFASSLDQIGPFARDVMDAALALKVIAGHDRMDATSAPEADRLNRIALEPENGVRGLRIGIPKEYFGPGVEPGVRERVEAAIRQLEQLGATVGECSLPSTEYALDAYYIIAPAEASSNLARFDGVRYGHRTAEYSSIIDMFRKTRQEGFGPEVKRRIMIGTYVLSAGYYDAYYKKAQQVRTLVVREFQQAFEQFDLLATPTAPTVAFGMNERLEDPLSMYLGDVCTIPVNLAGLPALSLPCGLSEGLPVGLQLIGRPFAEQTLLQAGLAFEKAAGTAQMRPPAIQGV